MNLTLDDEQQIHALFEAGDRALMSADVESLARIFADDYVQYDPAGRAFTKQEVLENLRRGTVRYPVINSTGRRIRLFGDFASCMDRSRTRWIPGVHDSLCDISIWTWFAGETGIGRL